MKVGDIVKWESTHRDPSKKRFYYYGIIIKRWHDGISYMDSAGQQPFIRMMNEVLLSRGDVKELSDRMLEVVHES